VRRIQAAEASGEICPLVGAAARERIMRVGRFVREGRMLLIEASFIAARAEALAMSVEPLPYE